ncbi:MAG: AraC family transcriptional regulator [Clostridiales bacterium]|nr:AraC family transcriptional regulator [Clostridiales bacterium]
MNQTSINDNKISITNPIILYYCGREQCKPSHTFGPAIRPHYLFHYILQGKGKYYVNGSTYKLKAGEGFLITPGVTTVYSADKIEPWEYCWIGFDGYDVKTILENCGLSETNLIYKDMSNGLLRENLLSLIQTFMEGSGNEYTYLSLLYLCFSNMYRPRSSSVKLIHETHIKKALNFIHHNYTYDIKIGDIATYLSIDRTYLYKIFMLHKKLSPQQYLINYRLNVAGKMLQDTNLSVTEIAYSCGFKDASSFNKHFKKYYHITPLQFRARTDYVMVEENSSRPNN